MLDVTAKDQNGKVLLSKQKEYTVNDYYFPGEGKKVPLADWDITAMEHIFLGLKPFKPDHHTFILPLSVDTKSVDVEVAFSYESSPGNMLLIKKANQKVEIR